MKNYMQSNFTKVLWVAVSSALWATGSVGWAEPRIAIHPLGAAEGLDEAHWNAVFMREVEAESVELIAEETVKTFLEGRNGSCDGDLECLHTLCLAAEAHYVLEWQLSKRPTGYVAKARVVREDGTVEKEAEVGPLELPAEQGSGEPLYDRLFEALQLGSLGSGGEATPEQKSKPFPLDDPLSRLDKNKKSPEHVEQPKRISSAAYYSLYTVFAVSGATGGILHAAAHSDAKKFTKDFATEESPRTLRQDADRQAAKKLANKIGAQRSLAVAFYSIASVSAITVVMLYIVDAKRKPPVDVGFMPTQGGALFSLQGRF